MATSSFERKITLDEVSARRLVKKLESDKNKTYTIRDIDIDEKLKRGKEIIERLFDKKSDNDEPPKDS